MIEYTIYTEEEVRGSFKEFFKDHPPIAYNFNGRWVFITRDDAIKLGVIRDPKESLTLRDRVTQAIRDWHSRMAAWHERRSIGLR